MTWQAVLILANSILIAILAVNQKDHGIQIGRLTRGQFDRKAAVDHLQWWQNYQDERITRMDLKVLKLEHRPFKEEDSSIQMVKDQLKRIQSMDMAGMTVREKMEVSDMVLRYADWIAKNAPQCRETENESGHSGWVTGEETERWTTRPLF